MQICPAYMAMGMTWKEFWNCNTKVHKAYRLAWEQKRAYRNWEMWWQGNYIYEALLKVAPVMRAAFGNGKVEAGKYAEEPYPLTQREAEERRQAKRRQKMEQMLEMFKRESEENVRKRGDRTPSTQAKPGPPPLGASAEAGEATDAAGDGGPHPSASQTPSPPGEGFERLEAKGD